MKLIFMFRFNTFSKNSFICIGGSGIDPATTEADVEHVIQTTLEQVARDGFEEARIDGLMNEMELMYKQIKRSIYDCLFFLFIIVIIMNSVWTCINAKRNRILDTWSKFDSVLAVRRTAGFDAKERSE